MPLQFCIEVYQIFFWLQEYQILSSKIMQSFPNLETGFAISKQTKSKNL